MSTKAERERKRYTVRQTADILAISRPRVQQKVEAGNFPNHERCECKHSVMIPVRDIHAEFHRMITESYKVKFSDRHTV